VVSIHHPSGSFSWNYIKKSYSNPLRINISPYAKLLKYDFSYSDVDLKCLGIGSPATLLKSWNTKYIKREKHEKLTQPKLAAF